MAASSEKLARPAPPSDSLMRLGSVRDVVLARVPLEAHRALGQTCKALRRLVYSDDFAKLRKTLGCEEYGLLLLAGSPFYVDDDEVPESRRKQFVCLTHNLESLGFAALDECPLNLSEFTTALSADGRLVVCGDSNFDRKVLIYDTREHVWVRDSRYPASLPVVMYGNCTAFLDNTLVAMAGGTQGLNQPWAFAWNEQFRMWEHLPPCPLPSLILVMASLDPASLLWEAIHLAQIIPSTMAGRILLIPHASRYLTPPDRAGRWALR
jgi:hypothetical protein